MWIKTRLLMMALLVGALLAQPSLAFVSDAVSAPVMTMPHDCCPSDCPDMPECDALCRAVMQCRAAPLGSAAELVVLQIRPQSQRLSFVWTRIAGARQLPTDGLRRPPKA
jgi:hypothetical protein